MGSLIEINDTLQLTRAQGFPAELILEQYLKTPLLAEQFQGVLFPFSGKPKIRIYHAPPVRCFLVENIEGKWLYWGLAQVHSVSHDLEKQTTSGTFSIHYLYTPEEMKIAHRLIDRNVETDYFDVL
jgi:hypothetical protein